MGRHSRPAAGADASRPARTRSRLHTHQAAAKYRRFAYSSAFGFSPDAEGNRRVRFDIDAASVEDGMGWSIWHPWPDIRIDTVCWAIDARWHRRLHRIRTGRRLTGIESGFAIVYVPRGFGLDRFFGECGPGRAMCATRRGCSPLLSFSSGHHGSAHTLAVNANLVTPRAAAPVRRLRSTPAIIASAARCSPNRAPRRFPTMFHRCAPPQSSCSAGLR